MKDETINTDGTEPVADTTTEPAGILSAEAAARLKSICPPPTEAEIVAAAVAARKKAVAKRVAASRARKKALLRHLDKEAAAALEPESDDDRSRRLQAEEEAERDRLEQNFLDDIEFGLEDCGENPPDADLQSKIDKFLAGPEKNLKFDFLLVYLSANGAGRAILASMGIESPFGPDWFVDSEGVKPMVRGSMRGCTDGSWKYVVDNDQEEVKIPLKSSVTINGEQRYWSEELKAYAMSKSAKISNARRAAEGLKKAARDEKMKGLEQKYVAARKKSKAAQWATAKEIV